MTILQQFLQNEKESNFVLADAIYRLCQDCTNNYDVVIVAKMLLTQAEVDRRETNDRDN